MKNNFKSELIISTLLIILLIYLLDPFGIHMSATMQLLAVIFIILLLVLFLGFVWKEKVRDERESLHRHISSRFAYLAGVIVLALGVIIQALNHQLDFWLVLALCTMILFKMFGLIFSQLKH